MPPPAQRTALTNAVGVPDAHRHPVAAPGSVDQHMTPHALSPEATTTDGYCKGHNSMPSFLGHPPRSRSIPTPRGTRVRGSTSPPDLLLGKLIPPSFNEFAVELPGVGVPTIVRAIEVIEGFHRFYKPGDMAVR